MAPGTFNTVSKGWRIAIVGAGAIGNAVLPHLNGSLLRKVTIIDGDRVELKNLGRQPLFQDEDAGRFKASTLAQCIGAGHVDAEIVPQDVFLDLHNAEALLRDHDVVIEGVDDLHAKALIDRICRTLRIPLVSGAVHAGQGQVIVLHAPGANRELTRAELFAGSTGPEQDGCDMHDVPIELLEVIGERMGALALDMLGGRPVVNGRIELLEVRSERRMIIEPAS